MFMLNGRDNDGRNKQFHRKPKRRIKSTYSKVARDRLFDDYNSRDVRGYPKSAGLFQQHARLLPAVAYGNCYLFRPVADVH